MAILISFKEQNQTYIKFLCVKDDLIILSWAKILFFVCVELKQLRNRDLSQALLENVIILVKIVPIMR